MEELKKFYNQNKKMARNILWLIAAAILIVPLVINIAFQCKAICKWFDAEWEASDALSYYGNVLSFLGTVVLSGLALWQNHKIQEANTAHTKLLEDMERDKNAPFLFFISNGTSGQGGSCRLAFQNVSNNLAIDVKLFDFELRKPGNDPIWHDPETYTYEYLQTDTQKEIILNNKSFPDFEYILSFKATYSDIYGEQHSCNVIGTCTGKSKSLIFKTKKEKNDETISKKEGID